jgi:hypothetical protein
MSRHRGWLLALLVAAAALALQAQRYPLPRYDRFDLPAFDSHVYIAMAEHPTVFTVAPWGYRLLTPALVHVLPVRTVVKGFRMLTLGALALSGVLLYLYLRRLGHREALALGSVAVYGLSPPVAEALRYRFLVEPLTFALELAFLLAIELGAGAPALGLLAAVGTLSKEFFLLLLPLIYLRRRGVAGDRAALAMTAVAAIPALALLVLLRLGWTPGIHVPWPRPGLELLGAAVARVSESWREWWLDALLLGITPLTLAGALRPAARPLRLPCAYLFVVAFVLPFLNPVTFFPRDISRLLVYALPAVLPLALAALDLRWSCPMPAVGPNARWTPALASLALLAALAVGLDRYRRVDLQGPRDGPLVLAHCRETLRTAGRLERGQEVSFDLGDPGFVWGESDPGELGRMRWFLRDGWGPRPHYGTGDVVLAGERATLLVPTYGGRALDLLLTLDAPRPVQLRVSLNGRGVGEAEAVPEGATTTLRLPAEALLRGDNVLELARSDTDAPTRLRQVILRPLVDRPAGAS